MNINWLLLFSLVMLLLASWLLPRHRIVAQLAALLGTGLALISSAHVVSKQLSGSGINEAVLYHLLVGLGGAGFGEYHSTMLLAAGLLVASLGYGAGCHYLAMRRHHGFGRLAVLPAAMATTIALGSNPG